MAIMLRRIWYALTDRRTLGPVGLLVLLALGAGKVERWRTAMLWALALLLAVLLTWGGVWLWRRHQARRKAAAEGEPAETDLDGVRKALLQAVRTIRKSRLGKAGGRKALYELPWYMVIGNPSAGKSSAIAHSGLQFPYADASAIQGVGGTRHCDWFLTTEGILLDTAGRYSVDALHREEWHGFLALLKKHRSRAPINGIIVAVSVAELRDCDPEAAMLLARSLRQRVQDLIEKLEVFAPLYLVFTKTDLIAGFADFFGDAEKAERERVWGATKPFQRKAGCQEALAFFEQSFEELHEGLRDAAIAIMTQRRRECVPSGIHTFPLEFSALKAPIKAFLATLCQDNPYQFHPVLRGYYFTSALQEGQPECAQSRRVAQRFGLAQPAQPAAAGGGAGGYFLPQLFRSVIFADKDLVAQYTSRRQRRLRMAGFVAGALLLGLALGGWSWSYSANRELLAHVQADLDKAVNLQARQPDLQARLEALEILQDRLEQLDDLGRQRPLWMGLGLYQGDELARKLRQEYMHGMQELLVKPAAAGLEGVLAGLNGGGDIKVEEGYNALKAYLMLADKRHADAMHLSAELARHWRDWLEANRAGMQREQMIRSAERLLGYFLGRIDDPAWPLIAPRLALVDGARERLRKVVKGMDARARVYAEIKARANTRYQPMTVARLVGKEEQALVLGSHAVPGAFTQEAWSGYVKGAIHDAANRALQSHDWVLQTASNDDLTLEGSPEQIEKALSDTYKAEYSKEWRQFLQGVAIADLDGFGGVVAAMDRLGDPASSPLLKVWHAVAAQTGWDGAVAPSPALQAAGQGWQAWLPAWARGQAAPVQAAGGAAAGVLGRDFAPVARLTGAGDREGSLMKTYMDALSRLRTRLNAIRQQGDPGPGARQLMQQTLEGSGSELGDVLRHVDEQMMAGLDDTQKQVLRPLLVRPLMQVFAGLLGPVEAELNKIWLAQVYQPFTRTLLERYPFAPQATVEASAAEIGQIFGPDGAIARFAGTALAGLVVRRGDVLAPRTWADMGVGLAPEAMQRYPDWIAPLAAGGVAASSQTVFQLLPHATPRLSEYAVEIDGQVLRYRNGTPQWTNMVHPGPQGVPGARISATLLDGRQIEVFSMPGPDGLRRMIDAAARTRRNDAVHQLSWSADAVTVSVDLRIVSTPAAPSGQRERGFQGMRLPETIAGGAGGARGGVQ